MSGRMFQLGRRGKSRTKLCYNYARDYGPARQRYDYEDLRVACRGLRADGAVPRLPPSANHLPPNLARHRLIQAWVQAYDGDMLSLAPMCAQHGYGDK